MSRYTREEIERYINSGCFYNGSTLPSSYRLIKQQSADIERLCKELDLCNRELKGLDFAKEEYDRIEKLLKEIRE